jgi:hypothetical protein
VIRSRRRLVFHFRSAKLTESGAFVYGWAIGGGLEVMVMRTCSARRIRSRGFSPIWNITAIVQTARLGAGFKF